MSGLDRALSMGLAAWRKPLATHDPGKIVTDLAVVLALGGDTLSDVGVLRGEPGVYGLVASDPTVSRAITALAGDADTSIAAISSARAAARPAAWAADGEHARQTRLRRSRRGLLDLKKWPTGMRVIVGRERPDPGAQLRFEDVDGYRLAAFATNTARGQLPDLELRHRRRARCEDRIRLGKDTGLRNLCH